MKARIRKTGEIVDLDSFSETFLNKYGLSSFKDIEILFSDNNYESNKYESVDWEQRRYEIAKAALVGLITRLVNIIDNFDTKATLAIKYADALIAELKKK